MLALVLAAALGADGCSLDELSKAARADDGQAASAIVLACGNSLPEGWGPAMLAVIRSPIGVTLGPGFFQQKEQAAKVCPDAPRLLLAGLDDRDARGKAYDACHLDKAGVLTRDEYVYAVDSEAALAMHGFLIKSGVPEADARALSRQLAVLPVGSRGVGVGAHSFAEMDSHLSGPRTEVTPEAHVKGSLPPELAFQVLRRNRNQVAYCYELAQAKAPCQLTLSFAVDANGAVAAADASVAANSCDPQVATCAAGRPRHWVFPRAKDRQGYQVDATFKISLEKK